MALLAQRLQRRESVQHALARQRHRHLRAFAQLRFEIERAAVQVNEVLHDRQPEAGAAFRRLVRERALSEGLQDARNFVLRNTGARVAIRS